MSTTENGNQGELEVIELVPCPNCGKRLKLLPPSFPMADVQCEGCHFRAQIKTSNGKPKSVVFGSTWNVTQMVLKAGYLLPPLFLNFKWVENAVDRQQILFYPFVPKKNLRQRTLSPNAVRAGLKMFDYIGLDKLPHFVVYVK